MNQNGIQAGPSHSTNVTPQNQEIDTSPGGKAALNGFISRYSDHLRPFFKALKGSSSRE